jgi:ZIP family zinc transporter
MVLTALLYAVAPTLAIPAGAGLIAWRPPSPIWRSVLLHVAAGGLIAVIAVELLGELKDRSPWPVVGGVLVGALFMAAVETAANRAERSSRSGLPAGFVAVVAVDFLIDGLLLGLALRHDAAFGVVLAVALTLEDLVTGLSVSSALIETATRKVMLTTMALIAVGFPLGAVAGSLLGSVVTGAWYVAVLAFAAVALLFLALEELLREAHEVTETPLVTSTLFLGMLAFLLLEMAVSH